MSIKISKISFFCSLFKLNEKKNALVKSIVWRGGVTRKFFAEMGEVDVNRGSEMVGGL